MLKVNYDLASIEQQLFVFAPSCCAFKIDIDILGGNGVGTKCYNTKLVRSRYVSTAVNTNSRCYPPPPHSYKVTLFTTRLPNQSCNAISGALSQQCQAILASLHTYVYWDIQAANYFHKVPALSSLLGVIYIHNTSTIIVQ